jgi:hypothetical protein
MSEIAAPGLVHVWDLQAEVTQPIDIGPTPHGGRRIIPISGGKVFGPRLNGAIIPGGADFQYWRSDGVTEVHARYVIEAEGGVKIYIENSGLRHGPPEAMARLARGEPVDPSAIYFRTVARLETSAAEFLWTMRSIFLCSGARYPDRVLLRYFEVA